MSSPPSDLLFPSDLTACVASICHSEHYDGYTLIGLLIALAIFVFFLYRKKISLKKYLLSQVILFLFFSSTFISNGLSFGCCGDVVPKRILSEIWSIFPDQFTPIYFDRMRWFLDFLDLIK